MRLTNTLIAITALGLGATAFAQEEQAPTPAEEQSPTTIQETQPTTPSVETSPSAETKPSPPADMSPAAKPEKMATPAAKPSPAKAASPAMAGQKLGVEAALKDNENRWEAAVASHDPSATQSLIAADFVGIYWDGKGMNKSGVLSQIKKDKDTYKSAVNEKLAVHMYGKNVAVVVGTAHEKGTTKDGKPFDRQFRFTDTWVERNGQWQCVSSQVMKTKG